jgi:hypothetical protein
VPSRKLWWWNRWARFGTEPDRGGQRDEIARLNEESPLHQAERHGEGQRTEAGRQAVQTSPDGETIVAPLPSGIRGLRSSVWSPLLQAVGLSISRRQLMSLLIDQQDDFLSETRDVLRTGLRAADWISVDDTGVRHRGAHAVCTQIGNDKFAPPSRAQALVRHDR